MFKQNLLESIYHFDKTDGIGNLSILWLLSLLPSQISSSTMGNAEARLKNEELYAGTRKQSVTVHQVWSYLGKLTQ